MEGSGILTNERSRLLHPTNVKWLVEMLRPLDKTVKKACYVAPKSRCMKLIARKLVERKELSYLDTSIGSMTSTNWRQR
jgi:hypothetical protein